MSLESEVAGIIGNGLIQAAGGSVVLLGLIVLIGLAILMKKLSIGVSSAAVISVFILGFLAEAADSKNLLNATIGGQFPFFRTLYLFVLIGGAIYWAIFLRRR